MQNLVIIRRDPDLSPNCIVFEFNGKFTTDACQQAVSEFNAKYPISKLSSLSFVWDCTEMTGFDLTARKHWVDFIDSLGKRISRVNVISDKIVIRGSARLLLKLLNLEGEVYKHYSALQESKTKQMVAA